MVHLDQLSWVGHNFKPIYIPFPDIAVHVKKAPRVGCVITHFTGLTNSAGIVVRPSGVTIIPPGICRSRARPAGVFPLSFGGQDIGPASREVGRLEGI